MADKSISDKALIDKLRGVFQQYGFAGASLSVLSEATGLKRASLYHRFPGGKDEIANAVVQAIIEQFTDEVLNTLKGTGEPNKRVKTMGKALLTFFNDGRYSCLFETMSLHAECNQLHARIKTGFIAWRDAMREIAVEAGKSKREAEKLANAALVELQGALVFSRVTGQNKEFKIVVEKLPNLLT